jgi:hypothetical protein
MIEDINIPIEHLNNSDAPYNVPEADTINYPHGEPIHLDDDFLLEDEDDELYEI